MSIDCQFENLSRWRCFLGLYCSLKHNCNARVERIRHSCVCPDPPSHINEDCPLHHTTVEEDMEQEAQLEQKAYLPLPFKSPEVKTCPYLMAGFLAGRHEVTDPWGITCCMGTSCAIYNTCIGAKK
jgi:hypothetical protein